jgi:hypothetical protein
MKHLLIEQAGGRVQVKCGAVIKNRSDATVWYSEVDCPECSPYEWVDDPNGVGKMMVERKRPKKRIVRTPRPLV